MYSANGQKHGQNKGWNAKMENSMHEDTVASETATVKTAQDKQSLKNL
jgi:hypothetical protein